VDCVQVENGYYSALVARDCHENVLYLKVILCEHDPANVMDEDIWTTNSTEIEVWTGSEAERKKKKSNTAVTLNNYTQLELDCICNTYPLPLQNTPQNQEVEDELMSQVQFMTTVQGIITSHQIPVAKILELLPQVAHQLNPGDIGFIQQILGPNPDQLLQKLFKNKTPNQMENYLTPIACAIALISQIISGDTRGNSHLNVFLYLLREEPLDYNIE